MDTDQTQEPTKDEVGIKPEGWKKIPSVRDLEADFRGAKTDHDNHMANVKTWRDYQNVEGQAKLTPKKNRSRVQPKLIQKHAEWRYPALSEPFLTGDGIFRVSPRTWEDAERAKQNQLVLNYQFDNLLNKTAFIDKLIRAAVNDGTAIIRTGWAFQEVTEEEEREVFEFIPDPGAQQLIAELQELSASNPTEFAQLPLELQEAMSVSVETGVPHFPVSTGEFETVSVTRTVKNQPTVEVCNIDNVVVDPNCGGDVNAAAFITYSFESNLSDLRKEGIYSNLDEIKKYGTTSPLEEPDHVTTSRDTNFSPKDESQAPLVVREYWGYWDYEDTGVAKPFVAAWIGSVMIRLESSPLPFDGSPFDFIQLRPDTESVYGKPDGELIIDNQKIIGAVTRGMIDIMAKAAAGQKATRQGALDPMNRRKMEAGDDFEFAGQATDPNQIFHTFRFDELPQSGFQMIQQQTMEAESMNGIKAFSDGMNSGSLGDVATGIRGVLDAASKRETSILRRFASGLESVGRKIIAMNAEFMEDEEVIRLTNSEFATVRRDDLGGAYDLKLDISSAEEDNAKAQEIAFMMQTMGNTIPIEVTKKLIGKLMRLRKMPDLAEEVENFEPQPDPVEEERKQLENLLLRAKIANELSQAKENEAEAQLDMAKAREAMAKEANLLSDRDKKDLDFIEQESGVTQEREKELLGEQARSNMELAAVKAYLAKSGQNSTVSAN